MNNAPLLRRTARNCRWKPLELAPAELLVRMIFVAREIVARR